MYPLHMSRLLVILAMMCFVVLSAAWASAQQSTPDRQPQSATQKISRVQIPTYLAESITRKVVLPRDLGISGDVVLKVLVESNGRVLNVECISGDPRLVRAAKPALMKWIFAPYFLDGEPVQFVTELTIMFDGKKDSAKLKIESDPLSSLNPEPR
jgi:outer membrane biosynthesis protein TonB